MGVLILCETREGKSTAKRYTSNHSRYPQALHERFQHFRWLHLALDPRDRPYQNFYMSWPCLTWSKHFRYSWKRARFVEIQWQIARTERVMMEGADAMLYVTRLAHFLYGKTPGPKVLVYYQVVAVMDVWHPTSDEMESNLKFLLKMALSLQRSLMRGLVSPMARVKPSTPRGITPPIKRTYTCKKWRWWSRWIVTECWGYSRPEHSSTTEIPEHDSALSRFTGLSKNIVLPLRELEDQNQARTSGDHSICALTPAFSHNALQMTSALI